MSPAAARRDTTMSIGEVLAQARRRLPGRLGVEDPALGDRGTGRAGSHAVRLPALPARGRRAAALRDDPAARPLLAAASHPRPPRRRPPRRRGPGHRGRRPADGALRAVRRRRRRARAGGAAPGSAVRLSAAERAPAPGSRPGRLDEPGRVRPAAAVRCRLVRRERARRRHGGRRAWRRSASSRATCARSASPPTARSGWSSRW
nr:hypothetical protein [Angustibacter aerolatus]